MPSDNLCSESVHWAISTLFHKQSYFADFPFAFSTGYFLSFIPIFIFTISSASSPSLSKRFWEYTITSASSSFTCCRSYSSSFHWKHSRSSAASMTMDFARFAAEWNCSQSRSSVNLRILSMVSCFIKISSFPVNDLISVVF